MAFRPDIVAGKAVILVSLQENIDKELRRIRTTMRRFANSMSDIAGDLFRFGAVGTVGAFFPVREFVEFQDRLLFIQTKLQATDGDMNKLEGTIRNLGKSTSFTSTQVGGAAQQFAQAGFSLAEVQQSLQAALDLARGGETDITTAATTIVQGIRSFKLEASDAAEVASKFITAARLGPLTVVDLGEALKFTATTASSLNVNLADTLAVITTLSQRGLRGTLAGTSINKALQSLAVQKDKLQDLLGLEFKDADFEDSVKLFTKVGLAISKLGTQDKVRVLNEIASIRGARAIGPITDSLKQLQSASEQITASLDEARTAAVKLDSRLGGVFRRGLSAFQELLLSVGSTSEGPLSKFGIGLRGIFNDLSDLSQANPEFVQTLLLIPPISLAAGAGMLAFGLVLQRVAGLITPLISLNGLLFSSLVKIVGLNAAPLATLISRYRVV